MPSLLNSVAVGLLAVALSIGLGAPAGYAIARYALRGRDAYQIVLLITRALPVVVLSIPLAELFINWRLYDAVLGIALMHTALALPTTVLITASVFVAVPRGPALKVQAASDFRVATGADLWLAIRPAPLRLYDPRTGRVIDTAPATTR